MISALLAQTHFSNLSVSFLVFVFVFAGLFADFILA